MHAGLLLGVRILDQDDLGVGLKVWDLGQLDKVIDTVAVEFEMEAGILESSR
jgi:hypothetical protein